MASNRFASASRSLLWTVVRQCVAVGMISTYCRQAKVRLTPQSEALFCRDEERVAGIAVKAQSVVSIVPAGGVLCGCVHEPRLCAGVPPRQPTPNGSIRAG
jgi:hypothetical protein